jgi:hypothetical protein
MADFGDYVTPRDLELAADRARRIRALAAMKMATDYAFGSMWSSDDERDIRCRLTIERSARIIDALDALPVPERGK